MGKKRKQKNKIEKHENNSIINYIILHKELITIIFGLCVAVYPIINTIYKIMYQIECENFYGIPGKYFDSNIDIRLLYLFIIVIFLLMGTMPTWLKKYYEKRGELTKGTLTLTIFYAVIIGLALGFINVYNLIEIMKQTYRTHEIFGVVNNWLNSHAYFTIIVVLGFGSISTLGLTLMDCIANIKYVVAKNIVCVILAVSLIASLVVMFYGTIFKLSISIEDKSKYEFITYNEEEYVVLSSYNEKVLIVPFETDDNKEQYTFKTSQYSFISQDRGVYKYKEIKNRPIIN